MAARGTWSGGERERQRPNRGRYVVRCRQVTARQTEEDRENLAWAGMAGCDLLGALPLGQRDGLLVMQRVLTQQQVQPREGLLGALDLDLVDGARRVERGFEVLHLRQHRLHVAVHCREGLPLPDRVQLAAVGGQHEAPQVGQHAPRQRDPVARLR